MSSRLRRPAALLVSVLLATTLAACGDDNSSGSSDALSAVSIKGDPSQAPQVTWSSDFKADKVETSVLTKGDGATVKSGDQVVANIWIGNGVDEKQVFSTYTQGQPQTVTVNDTLSPVFKDAFEGQTIGSRVAVAAPASDAFGESGNAQLGIGNADSVLVIVDLVKMYTPPKPVNVPQSKMPRLEIKNGDPVGFDFKGIAKPKADAQLERTVLKQGKGKTVTTSMSVTANYLGMVYGATKPFDESYTKKPVPFSLSGVIPGWTYGLSGLKVGSRVLLAIPPQLGYGAQAQSGIPANSTLYFVVDIISAK